MEEALRQQYLRAMGFTPWVARRRLPGAAATPLLPPMATGAPSLEETPADQALEQALRGPAHTPEKQEKQEKPEKPEKTTAAAQPQEEKPPARAAPQPVGERFGLDVHAVGDLRLVFQLSVPDAPEPGREESRLLAALLAVWGGRPGRPRRLRCPLHPGERVSAGEARELLNGFLGQVGGQRVLLCVDEHIAGMVGDLERYRPRDLEDGRRLLAVSAPAEMLAEPAVHKRASWRAMVEAGFNA